MNLYMTKDWVKNKMAGRLKLQLGKRTLKSGKEFLCLEILLLVVLKIFHDKESHGDVENSVNFCIMEWNP